MYASNSAVNLLKKMANTNYLVFVSYSGTSLRENVPAIHSKTTNSFKVIHNAGLNNDFGLYYYVSGY